MWLGPGSVLAELRAVERDIAHPSGFFDGALGPTSAWPDRLAHAEIVPLAFDGDAFLALRFEPSRPPSGVWFGPRPTKRRPNRWAWASVDLDALLGGGPLGADLLLQPPIHNPSPSPTMQPLTASDLPAFMDRFCDFDDAVLRDTNVNLRTDAEFCDLRIEAPDRASPSGWSNVTIRVLKVSRVHLDRTGHCIEVLTCGLQLFFTAEGVSVFLDADVFPEDMPEISKNSAYVTGAGIQWQAEFIQGQPR
jgi:hypothetical protein